MAPSTSPAEWAVRRLHMVESQLRPCDVTDLALLAAFNETPRESYVDPNALALAYLDREAPSSGFPPRMLLAPVVLARLLQAAKITPGEKALDVAGGSGYSAAIMTALGATVHSLDQQPSSAAAAPFDVVLINGVFERSPDEFVNMLSDGGRLIGIEAISGAPRAVLIEKIGGAISRRQLFDANGAHLSEFRRADAFVF